MRADRRTDMTKPVVSFRNFVDVPKNVQSQHSVLIVSMYTKFDICIDSECTYKVCMKYYF
jgi:hypothetical protein